MAWRTRSRALVGYRERVCLGGKDKVALGEAVYSVGPYLDNNFTPSQLQVWVVVLRLRESAYTVDEGQSPSKVSKGEVLYKALSSVGAPSWREPVQKRSALALWERLHILGPYDALFFCKLFHCGRPEHKTLPVLIAITYITCAVVWGTTWFAIRVCIGEGGFPTLTSAALRFTIAAVTLHVIVAVLGSGPRIRSWRQRSWLGGAGLLNGAGYALVYLGEETVPGAFASILFGTLPLITAFLAGVSRTEKVHLGHILGAVIALAGIVIIFGDRASVSSGQGSGVALLCGGVVLSAIYSLVLKRESSGVHALCATSWFLTVTAVVLWVAALATEGWTGPWPSAAAPTLALFYLALVGSVLTFASYLYLLQRVSLMTTTTLVFIQPVIALFVDSQWEPDVQLTLASYLGATITLSGVLVATLWKRTLSRKRGVS